MKIRTSYEILEKALEFVNSIFENNIRMEIKDRGLYYLVRLKVRDSKKKGARRSPNGRRTSSACWHAHGLFIDWVFKNDPDARVETMGKIYNKDTWEWVDWSAGSVFYPIYMSELCDCGKELDK
mgnify:CR=1 FL=1